MSRRSSRGTKQNQLESISDQDENDECPDEHLNQFQGEYEAELDTGLRASGKSNLTGLVTYSPDENQPQNLGGAGSYQGSPMRSGMESSNSRAERFYHEDHGSRRRTPDYQPFEISPDYQSAQVSPGRQESHHMSFHERNEFSSRSFHEQGGEALAECEERPSSRAASPQYRQSMSPRDDHVALGGSPQYRQSMSPRDDHVALGGSPQYRQSMSPRDDHVALGASPGSYGARFQLSYDNAPMNATSSTVSPFHDSTMYREIASFPSSAEGSRKSSRKSSPKSSRKSPLSADKLESQNFIPDNLEQQFFSPDSLEQQNFSPDSLEQQNFSSDCHESQQFSPDSLELRNTSGSPGPRISPDYLNVPHNSPSVKQSYPHRSSLRTPRTPRTPQPSEEDMNEECGSGGGTFRKQEPDFLCVNSGSSGFNVTPSPAASSAPSYGKFGLTSPSPKSRGASPPIPYVGGTPKDCKREALEQLSQLTISKPGKSSIGGSPKECKREALEQLAQLTVSKPGKSSIGGSPKECKREALTHSPQLTETKPGKPCIGASPKEVNREAVDQCPPCTMPKSVAPRCKRALNFGQVVDLGPCDGQSGTSHRRLPKKPELSQDEIKELIDSEAEDVDFAWLLSTDQKQTYKKPCPKQQKAQMTVKHMVETAQKTKGDTCAKEYPPLLEPEPEDLSPEVAAAMMFSQEQGIKLDSCPDQTISHLFPSESFQKKHPPSKISIVDPNQKDKEELMEKSASVPSEGVSDSAYTKTMKQKGGDEIPSQKSYDLDFALGQEKREVVLVPQRPKRFNTIQFRGNLTPWFPGYFSAFPDQTDSIRIVPSPSKLFLKAWIMTNPAHLPASDIIVIE